MPDNKLIRGIIAEFLGTFTLVFVGAASVVVAPVFGLVAPAFGHGLILVGLIFAYGHLSGAQFNPAVSVALWVSGRQSLSQTGIFIGVQFIAGIIAAFAMVALIGGAENPALLGFLGGDTFNHGQTKGFLTDDNVWNAALIEGVLVFLLVSAIYQSAVYGKAGGQAAIAIGFTLAALIFATGPMTGASINPARTLGPALAASDLTYVIPYFVGLFAGGIAGGLFQSYILPSDDA